MGGRGAKYHNANNISSVEVVDQRNTASNRIRNVIQDISANGYSTKQPFAIGLVEKRMVDFAEKNDIEIPSKSIYISSNSIAHSIRQSKQAKGLSVSKNDFISFPKGRKSMDLYYDGNGFIYTNYETKYIIKNKYNIKIRGKKTDKVYFLTAGKVTDANEFKLKKYTKI